MKLEEWKTYRTRFLVQAKQITSALTFVDHLGRQHCGRKGDYLVESSDGVLSIAPRHIFEDIYVPMSMSTPTPGGPNHPAASTATVRFEPLEIEEINLPESAQNVVVRNPPRKEMAQAKVADSARQRLTQATTLVRGHKLPQPCRDRRPSAPQLGLM